MPRGEKTKLLWKNPQYRKRLCESNKGRVPWNKGKTGVYSEEIIRKMSNSRLDKEPWNKGKYECFSKKIIDSWSKLRKGRILSYEHKEKISKSLKGKLPKNCTRDWTIKGRLKRQEMYINSEPTSIEKKVYDELKARGFIFETQKLINSKFIVDAYIPSLNLVIEADGDYWHSLPKVIIKDKSKDSYLKKCGYNLLHLTETDINTGNFLGKLPSQHD